MGISTTNYANIEPMQQPNYLKKALEGYEFAYTPYQKQQEMEKQALANRLMQIQGQYEEPNLQAKLLRQQMENQMYPEMARAQINAYNRQADPMNRLTGPAAEAYSLQMLKGMNPEAYEQASRIYEDRFANSEALRGMRQMINDTRRWNGLTSDQKENIAADYRRAGIDELQIPILYSQGVTPRDYAIQNGMAAEDYDQSAKKFAPTARNRSEAAKLSGMEAENYMFNDFQSNAQAPFASRFFGWSPKQIAQQMSKEPETLDENARALASRIIGDELVGTRAMLSGTSNAHGAIEAMKKNAMTEFKVLQPFMSEELYRKTQQYANDMIQAGVNARIAVMKGEMSPEQAKKKFYDNTYLSKKGGQNVPRGTISDMGDDPLGLH